MNRKSHKSFNYCSLHTHTYFTNLNVIDAITSPEDLAKRAKQLGHKAICHNDHGNASAAIKMYEAAQKYKLKYIGGVEFYFTEDHAEKERKSNHLTAIALTNSGLSNLYRMITWSNVPVDKGGGYFYRPRISWKELEKYNKDILILSGCMSSIINKRFAENDYDAGKEYAKRFISIVGKNRFFVELQNTNENGNIYIPEQEIILELSRKLAKDLRLKSVASNDSHYLYKDDSFAHEVLKAIASKATLNTPILDHTNPQKGPARIVFNGFSYHIMSDEEMRYKFADEEVNMSGKIADMIDISIPLKQNHMPRFDPSLSDDEVMELLIEECRNGWKRFNINKKANKKEYLERLKKEFKDIKDASIQNYLMIVWDTIRAAKERNIPTGFARGSVGGSLTAYLLGITQGVDPVKYGLIWERFWNRGRIGSPPDIDLDFPIDRREEIVEYLRNKFGKDKVFPIMTMGTMAVKQAIKDVGKVLGLSFDYMNVLTKHVPHKCTSIQESIDKSKYLKGAEQGIDDDIIKWKKELNNVSSREGFQPTNIKRKIANREKILKKTFEIAKRLENIVRQRSCHACALLIADEPIMGKIPLCWDAANKKFLTGFDMYDIEKLGYLKLDILGLKTLSVVDRILPNGIQTIINHGFEDESLYKLISRGDTKGIFQLETQLGKSWCKKVKPQSLQDLSALVSIIRPAVLETGLANQYVKNKNTGECEYIHDDLEPILEDTHGILCYQEQAINIAKQFAGFSLEDSDLLRRAIGKKLPKEMAKLKEKFVDRVSKKYDNEKLAEELWAWLEAGAGYSFCHAHAIGYAMMAYTTAYCKHYHTKEFFEAMLQLSKNEQKPQEEISELFYDAKLFNVKICQPSLKEKNMDFELIDGKIHYGLKHIKHIGNSSMKKIKQSNVGSWRDLLNNIHLFKKDVLQALILSGALDYLDVSRSEMKARVDFIQSLTEKEYAFLLSIIDDKEHKFSSKKKFRCEHKSLTFKEAIHNIYMFLQNENKKMKAINSRRAIKLKEICEKYFDSHKFSSREKLGYEMYYLGIPVTCTTVDLYDDHRKTHSILEISREMNFKGVGSVGIINKITKRLDKNNKPMAFVGMFDSTYMMDIILFNSSFEKYKDIIKEGKIFYMQGSKKRDSLIVDIMEEL